MIAEMRDWAHAWDVKAFRRVARVERPGRLRALWRWFSRVADGPLYVLLAIGGAGIAPRGRFLLLAFVVAFTIELSLYKTLKKAFRRKRPFVALPEAAKWIVPPDEFSFPSGHTAGAFLMASLLSLVFPGWGFGFFLFAAMVGYSRVALGVHYPGDVLAGSLLGLGCSYLGWMGAGLL